jgi:hypothetical protein
VAKTQLKVEKGIPFPSRRTSELRKVVESMEVGDSFVVGMKARSLISGLAWLTKTKLATRSISEGEIRVWRIE